MGGLRISVHPLFFVFGLYNALTGKIFSFLIFTIVALLHELGHSFIAEKQGYKLNKISLMPYGAVVTGKIKGLKPHDEVLISVAGPLLNLFIAIFFIALWWVYPITYAFTDTVVSANLSIATINLLPFFPLDGGRILLALLSSRLKEETSLKICKGLSIFFALVLLVLFIISLFSHANLSMLFFASFVLFGAINKRKENTYVKLYNQINTDSLKRGVPYVKQAVSEEITLKKLISILDTNAINEIAVFRGETQILTLSQEKILTLTQNHDIYEKLKDAIDKETIK